MKYLACLALLAVAVSARADDELRLVFLGDIRPVLISVQAEIDGKPVREAWSSYLRKWFDLLDRDNDGSLDAAEAKNAPSELRTAATCGRLWRCGVALAGILARGGIEYFVGV